MTADPKAEARLLAAGWRFAAESGGTELERMLAEYRELGIEATTLAVDPASVGGRNACFADGMPLYRVYTRPAD